MTSNYYFEFHEIYFLTKIITSFHSLCFSTKLNTIQLSIKEKPFLGPYI